FEDPTAVTRRSQEPTNQQTPVIKGVLPDAPAPIVEPKPAPSAAPAPTAAAAPTTQPASGGFFGWLKGLFGGGQAEAPKVEAPAAKPATGNSNSNGNGNKDDKRDGRGNRRGGRRGERGGERGEGRGERGEGRTDRSADGRTERAPRGERNGERGDRGERGQRPAREGQERRQGEAQLALAEGNAEGMTEGTPQQASGQDSRRERGEGRRERGEGRRERAPRGERPAREAAAADTGMNPVSENAMSEATTSPMADGAATGDAPEGERRERRSRDRYGRDRRGDRPGRENTQGIEGAVDAPADIATMRTVTPGISSPALAPAAAASGPAARAPLPKVQPFELPVTSLQAVAQAAQMEWVQSDPTRVAEVQAAIAAEPKPVHVPRERPPLVMLDEGPLILVETRKDLSQMAMPFEP
ncbi:MAG: hypothetical protein RLZZ123_2072, partial [Pseudomonadota bacterium]